MKYFKVKYGLGEMDFLQIDENELQGAIDAMVNGTLLQTPAGIVKNILAIVPDWTRQAGLASDFVQTPQAVKDDYGVTLSENTSTVLTATPITPTPTPVTSASSTNVQV